MIFNCVEQEQGGGVIDLAGEGPFCPPRTALDALRLGASLAPFAAPALCD